MTIREENRIDTSQGWRWEERGKLGWERRALKAASRCAAAATIRFQSAEPPAPLRPAAVGCTFIITASLVRSVR